MGGGEVLQPVLYSLSFETLHKVHVKEARLSYCSAAGGYTVFRKEISSAKDKAAKRKELISVYRETFANPYVAAGRRLVDDIIEPSKTRVYLAMALEALHAKRELRPPKKHGLIPL